MKKIIGVLFFIVVYAIACILGCIFYLYSFKISHYNKGFNLLGDNETLDNIFDFLFD